MILGSFRIFYFGKSRNKQENEEKYLINLWFLDLSKQIDILAHTKAIRYQILIQIVNFDMPFINIQYL